MLPGVEPLNQDYAILFMVVGAVRGIVYVLNVHLSLVHP